MKKLTLALLAVAAFSFTGCVIEEDIDTKEYSFDVTIPVSANGGGLVENTVVQDMNLDDEVADLTGGKGSMDDVHWIRVKEARIELMDIDNENNAANFSGATVQISAEDGTGAVSGARSISDEFSNRVSLDNAFGEQDLKPAMSAERVKYRVMFDARRATTKEIKAQMKIKFVFHARYGV